MKGFLIVSIAILLVVQSVSADTLCGGDLIDAIQFVCGFEIRWPTPLQRSRRPRRKDDGSSIIMDCCLKSCNLEMVEQYCTKHRLSKRDVSATSLQLMPALPKAPVINKDIPRKPLTVKYSKYEIWQRKAAQRLRRGIRSIF